MLQVDIFARAVLLSPGVQHDGRALGAAQPIVARTGFFQHLQLFHRRRWGRVKGLQFQHLQQAELVFGLSQVAAEG